MQMNNKPLTKKYSIENLYNDIVRQFNYEEQTSEKELRDVKHILKVFNYFVTLVQEVENNDEYDVEKVIKNKLDNDTSLFAYTFFVSSRSQFDYSWSYLRKQWDEYLRALNCACKFILDMLNMVNVLYEHRLEFIAKEFVFADIFVLSFDKANGLPYIKIKWENINGLFNIDNSYHISAKTGDAILMTMNFCWDKLDNTDSFLRHLISWNRKDSVQDDKNNK